MLNAALRPSESLGYFLPGQTFYPAQFCQLAEIKPWFPPLNRVFLYPSQQFVYFGTAGAIWCPATFGSAGASIPRFRSVHESGNHHQWDWYARFLGFKQAFSHSQRVLGRCLAFLPHFDHDAPVRLETWLKGPVYYGSDVELFAGISGPDAASFGVFVAGDSRPAVYATLSRLPELPELPGRDDALLYQK